MRKDKLVTEMFVRRNELLNTLDKITKWED